MPEVLPEILPVETVTASAAVDWDDFVGQCPDATFFHRWGWRRIIGDTLGHRCHYLVCRRGSAVVGVLPLAEVRSALFGHSLCSLPFLVYGGPLGEPDAQAALLDAAVNLAKDLGVQHLEVRAQQPSGRAWASKDLYVTFRRAISADDDDNLKAIPRKQRAVIRKAIKTGLTSERSRGAAIDVAVFYRVFAESYRNLGTPVLGRKVFQAMVDTFGDAVELTLVQGDGEVLSAVLSFRWQDQILPYYGGGTGAARRTGAADFMYWEVMRRAAAEGVALFDFGRSKQGTGSYAFKKHWGFEPEPLAYEYWLPEGGEVPEVNPTNPRYQLLIRTWQRLPLPLANLVGPPIARQIG